MSLHDRAKKAKRLQEGGECFPIKFAEKKLMELWVGGGGKKKSYSWLVLWEYVGKREARIWGLFKPITQSMNNDRCPSFPRGWIDFFLPQKSFPPSSGWWYLNLLLSFGVTKDFLFLPEKNRKKPPPSEAQRRRLRLLSVRYCFFFLLPLHDFDQFQYSCTSSPAECESGGSSPDSDVLRTSIRSPFWPKNKTHFPA